MILTKKSDLIGSLASGLCLIHCIATPFIFVAHTMHHAHAEAVPVWWGFLDYIFIGISFFAVFWSAKHTTKDFMIFAFWTGWLAMTLIIINEKIAWMHLSEAFIYFPAIGLIFLHYYNKKYCQCNNRECCSDI